MEKPTCEELMTAMVILDDEYIHLVYEDLERYGKFFGYERVFHRKTDNTYWRVLGYIDGDFDTILDQKVFQIDQVWPHEVTKVIYLPHPPLQPSGGAL